MKSKYKTIRAKNDYERSMKLIRFAMGRGFSLDLIRKCIDQMGIDAEEEDMEPQEEDFEPPQILTHQSTYANQPIS